MLWRWSNLCTYLHQGNWILGRWSSNETQPPYRRQLGDPYCHRSISPSNLWRHKQNIIRETFKPDMITRTTHFACYCEQPLVVAGYWGSMSRGVSRIRHWQAFARAFNTMCVWAPKPAQLPPLYLIFLIDWWPPAIRYMDYVLLFFPSTFISFTGSSICSLELL